MKALIIGAAGFVGGYLADHLQRECGWSVSVTKMQQESFQREGISVYDLNILETDEVKKLLDKIKPDYIFHLAAQSSVSLSWKNPELTLDVNIKGCVNVLEAVRGLDYKPRVLLVGSSEEYGRLRNTTEAVPEETVLHPGNIYAASKACQNMIGKIYADAYQMEIIMVRAFNHIGPKQSSAFVVSDFCRQAAEIESGKKEPVMRVGNLSAKRDFTDVRDIVRAYALLIQRGRAGETYNVGSGKAIAINEILDMILKLSKCEIQVTIDSEKLRPVDIPVIEADIRKLVDITGWETQIPIEKTVQEILDFWRKNI